MKKIGVLLIGLLMIISVLAAQDGMHEPKTGINNPDIKNVSQGTGQGQVDSKEHGQGLSENSTGEKIKSDIKNKGAESQIQNKEQVRTQIGDLKKEMEQKKQQLNSEGAKKNNQQAIKNQNQVRIAAQTLSKMESMIGSRGKEISAIAKEFENSVQATVKSEEKIQTKSGFARFFTGGDHKAAEELESEVTKNQERIKELKQLKEEADCEKEVKEMIQEQIQQMENEQKRLHDLAQEEKQSKGLLGWIWK